MAIPILRQNASTKFSYKLDKLKEGEKISIVSDSMFNAMLNNEARKKWSCQQKVDTKKECYLNPCWILYSTGVL